MEKCTDRKCHFNPILIRKKLAMNVVKLMQQQQQQQKKYGKNNKEGKKTNFVNRFIYSIKRNLFRRRKMIMSTEKSKDDNKLKKKNDKHTSKSMMKDNHAQEYSSIASASATIKPTSNKSSSSPNVSSSSSTTSMTGSTNIAHQFLTKSSRLKVDIRNIIKVQSVIRSYQARKRFVETKKRKEQHEHTMNLIV